MKGFTLFSAFLLLVVVDFCKSRGTRLEQYVHGYFAAFGTVFYQLRKRVT